MILSNLVFLLILTCPQVEPEKEHSQILEVKVKGTVPGKGVIRVCIFDSEEDFFHHAMECIVIESPTESHQITVKFQNLRVQKYALVVYQDFNKNGKLDRNWIGLPSEPYGFSNNPSTLFGPPSFQKAAFELNESLSLTISL